METPKIWLIFASQYHWMARWECGWWCWCWYWSVTAIMTSPTQCQQISGLLWEPRALQVWPQDIDLVRDMHNPCHPFPSPAEIINVTRSYLPEIYCISPQPGIFAGLLLSLIIKLLSLQFLGRTKRIIHGALNTIDLIKQRRGPRVGWKCRGRDGFYSPTFHSQEYCDHRALLSRDNSSVLLR